MKQTSPCATLYFPKEKKKKNPSFVPFQGRPEKSGEFFYTYTYINIHILYIKGKQKKPIPAGKLITVLPTLHTIQ